MSTKTIGQLVEILKRADNAYYNQDESQMPDHEYDALKDELTSLDPTHPQLSQTGPVELSDSKWKKAKHKIAMTSLNKMNTVEDFDGWRRKRKISTSEYAVSDKADGISISIDWVNGKYTRAVTRGKDGVIGEDITINVVRMQNVPAQLPVPYTGTLRGEIVLTEKDFEAVNEIRQAKGEKLFENLRNGVSGLARKYKGPYCEYAKVIYYNATNLDIATKYSLFLHISVDLGLETVGFCLCHSYEEVEDLYEEYEDHRRAELDYDIDGMVVEINDIEKCEAQGMLHDNPAGAIAWKFGSLKGKTILKDVVWQLGKTGKNTPVAILEPLKLGGVTIRRASLHNYKNFIKLKPYKNAVCVISRRNDVIPFVEEIL